MNLHRSRGFTLIEMMIALVILGFVFTAALPFYGSSIQNMQTRATAESILNAMQLARAEAVRRNNNVQLTLAGTGWVVSVVRTGEQIQARPAEEGSATTTVTIAPAGATTVTFNLLGRVQPNNDGSPSLAQVDVGSSVLALPESRELRNTVGLGGNVRMCDTQVPAGDTRSCA
jgi:type IV fimbrial biogenesis protein FimT